MPNNEMVKAVKDAARVIRVLEKLNPNGDEIPETLEISVNTHEMSDVVDAIRTLSKIAKIRGAQQSLETALDTIARFYYSASYHCD